MCDQCDKDIAGLAREWAKARRELGSGKKSATVSEAVAVYERMQWLTRQLEDACLPYEKWERGADDLEWVSEQVAKFQTFLDGKVLHA